MPATLSLLIPTRQRTDCLRRLLDSLVATTADCDALEVVLVVDADDAESRAFVYPELRLRRCMVSPGLTMGQLNRAGERVATGELLMLLNDDVIVRTPAWDRRVVAAFADYPDGILLVHVNDTLMQQVLCTFPIVSRTYCRLADGICPPDYQRYCIDDHIEDVFNLLWALGRRRTVYLPDVVFEHLNAQIMPQGHREYHADPAILAHDEPRFAALFAERKELALRLLEHIDGPSLRAYRWQRQVLESLDDPLALRTPDRQRLPAGWSVPQGRPAGWPQRLSRCLQQRGVTGLAQAVLRRLRKPTLPPATPRALS